MEQERRDDTVSFAVDLSKEEYLQFYKVLTRYSSAGMMQKVGLVVVIAMVVLPLISLYQSGGLAALLSWEAVSLFIPPVLLLIYNFGIMPLLRKRQAEKGYDAALAGGQIFAGTVTVNRGRITKVTPSGSLTLPFTDRILFHEQEDMQIFVNTQGRGIVLPARCMTKENADAVREIATSALPLSLCKVKALIVCERETPMEITETAPTAPLFEANIAYTGEDRAFIAKELSFRGVKSSVLPGSIIGFMLALLVANGSDLLAAMLVFWGTLLIFVGFTFFSARSRAKFMLSQENFRFTFKITEKAVIADGGERRGIISIPWKTLKHAVEGKDYLEFYNQNQYICVPKRLIEDMDSFRRLVDTCRAERKG